MTQWQENHKTTPLQAIRLARTLLSSNENTGDVDAELLTLLIGRMLIQLHYTMQLSQWLDDSVRYNLDTHPMVEASLPELLEMVSRIMNTCDQLRTSISTSTQSQWISQNSRIIYRAVQAAEEMSSMALEYHGLG
jgi:hypothetical protein